MESSQKRANLLIDQLICQGITHFCIAPGSRSAPLAVAAASHPKSTLKVHFDERGLAFYALGLCLAQKRAAVITTSGTAVGHLLPACMEAFHSEVPLLFLTADRPCDLMHIGSNQTTHQAGLLSPYTLLSASLPEKEQAIRRLSSHLASFKGPVHLNCPFEEPLLDPACFHTPGVPFLQTTAPRIARLKIEAKRPLLFLSRLPYGFDLEPLLSLPIPILADPLSHARGHKNTQALPPIPPDLILHVGGASISPPLAYPTLHLNPFSMRLCFEQIHSADRFELEVNPWSCPAPLIQDISLKPLEGRPLFVGNSLAIRQIDRLFHPSRPTPIFCNRGLSGIDGNIATAAGLADGLGTPIRALIGDQAFLHDLNSLPLMGNVLLIVQNNRGGRIFDTLAHTAASPFNEKLFVNAHKLTFASAAALFEIPYFSKTALDETRGLIEWS